MLERHADDDGCYLAFVLSFGLVFKLMALESIYGDEFTCDKSTRDQITCEVGKKNENENNFQTFV